MINISKNWININTVNGQITFPPLVLYTSIFTWSAIFLFSNGISLENAGTTFSSLRKCSSAKTLFISTAPSFNVSLEISPPNYPFIIYRCTNVASRP
jgi:hypothetical protein